MSVQVNFHGTDVTARSQNYETFCTFEINADGNNVTVYIKSVTDARNLVNAAIEAYRTVEMMELTNRVSEVEALIQGDNYNDYYLDEEPAF